MASYVCGVNRSQSWPMTTRYRPLSDRHDRGARPVQGPGAGLYSAGRGFAPPGSTKPADAVFALRVTIPVALARARCALRLQVPASRPRPSRGRGSVASLPDPPSRASRRGASHRRRSLLCFRLLVKGLRLVSSSALTRRRRTLDVLPHPHPDRTPKTARASSNRVSPSPARRSAPSRPRSLSRHPPLILPPVSL